MNLFKSFSLEQELSQSVSAPLGPSEEVTQLLDCIHLLLEELSLDEVGELSVLVLLRYLVEVDQRLVHIFLQLEGEGEHVRHCPVFGHLRLLDVLEDNPAPSLLEHLVQVGEGHVIPVAVVCEGLVDVGSSELHVDLLVDSCLTLLVEILTTLGFGGHPDMFSYSPL